MASHVEGIWRDFAFKMIKPEDYPKVLDHLHKNFFLSTPLTQQLEYSKEYFDEFDKVYMKILPHNLSFYALDLKTNEIAGLRITYIQTQTFEEELASLGFKTKQMEIMNKIMGTVNKESKIYERFGIDFYINFYTACVDPKHRGQGLATEMYVRALKFVKSFEKYSGCYIKSNLTSPYTRQICNNFGFTELSRVYYNDFKDENGKCLTNGWKDDEFVAFMCLKLE